MASRDVDRCLARVAAVEKPAEARIRQQEAGLLVIDGTTCTKVFDAVDKRYRPRDGGGSALPL